MLYNGCSKEQILENVKMIENARMLEKARNAGHAYASQGGYPRPNIEMLQKRNNYTLEQANKYLRAYDIAVGTPEVQAVRKVTHAGSDCAFSGSSRPNIQTLLKRYTQEEAQIYLDAYDKAAATTPDVQALRKTRKIKKLGQACAVRGSERPTIEKLLKRYTQEEAQMYLEGYDRAKAKLDVQNFKAAGTGEKQALRKTKQQAKLKAKESKQPVKQNVSIKTRESVASKHPLQLENEQFNYSEYFNVNEAITNELSVSLDETPSFMPGFLYYRQCPAEAFLALGVDDFENLFQEQPEDSHYPTL